MHAALLPKPKRKNPLWEGVYLARPKRLELLAF